MEEVPAFDYAAWQARLEQERPLSEAVDKAILDWAEPYTASTVGLIAKDTWQGGQLRAGLVRAIVHAIQTLPDP